ncbi:MAG: 4'-phosphopantetheinyl transferase superfamily protein [Prevotella sp.]|nr:4'-phosphopantetheinyl transferase superfamily protein [Prevotella sp.]
MPLLEIRQLSPHTRLGLWRMDEPQEGTPRQRERLAEQLLLTAMMDGDTSYSIDHEPSGKPFLTSPLTPLTSHLSISHTRGYVVMLISEDSGVGVDIEYRSDRVERIASRFIRPDEQVESTDEKLLLWSAKEAVYKLFSEDRLAFFDMRVLSIGEGMMQIENKKRDEVVAVSYEFTPDYVLTYAILPAETLQG